MKPRVVYVIEKMKDRKWTPMYIYILQRHARCWQKQLKSNPEQWRLVKYVPEDSRRG